MPDAKPLGWVLVTKDGKPVSWHDTFYTFDPNIGGQDSKRQVADEIDRENAPHRWQPMVAVPTATSPIEASLEAWIDKAGELATAWRTAYETWQRDGTYTAKDSATGGRLRGAASAAREAFRAHLRTRPDNADHGASADRRDVRLIQQLEKELGCSPDRDVARRILAAIDKTNEEQRG